MEVWMPLESGGGGEQKKLYSIDLELQVNIEFHRAGITDGHKKPHLGAETQFVLEERDIFLIPKPLF